MKYFVTWQNHTSIVDLWLVGTTQLFRTWITWVELVWLLVGTHRFKLCRNLKSWHHFLLFVCLLIRWLWLMASSTWETMTCIWSLTPQKSMPHHHKHGSHRTKTIHKRGIFNLMVNISHIDYLIRCAITLRCRNLRTPPTWRHF